MVGSERSNRDDVYRILTNERRRAVLASLLEADSDVSVDQLASRVVERLPANADSRGRSVADIEIETELIHHHLPMLHDAGFVAYDPDRRVVEPEERLECVDLPELGSDAWFPNRC